MTETYKNIVALPGQGFQYFRHYFIPHEGNNHHPIALRPHALKFYAISMLVVKLGLAGFLYATFPTHAEFAELTEAKMLELTNASRVENGLPALHFNAGLSQSAKAKAQDMLAQGYFDHTGPDGKKFWQWIRESGYSYTTAGENLAMDFTTAESAHNALMASPTHRANILKSTYEDVGLAVVQGTIDGRETTILVEHFGKLSTPVKIAAAPKTPTPKQPTTPPAQKAAIQPVVYGATYLGMSEESVAMEPGQEASVWVDFRNTGTATWTNSGDHFVALNVTGPVGRTSAFQNAQWPAAYRPALLQQPTVKPGETGRFSFRLLAPSTAGTFNESFGLVVENLQWIDGGNVTLPVQITAPAPAPAQEPTPPAQDEALARTTAVDAAPQAATPSVIPSTQESTLLTVTPSAVPDWQRVVVEWGVRFFWAFFVFLSASLLVHLLASYRVQNSHVLIQTVFLIALAASMAYFKIHFAEHISHILIT